MCSASERCCASARTLALHSRSSLVLRSRAKPVPELGEFLPEDTARIGALLAEEFIAHFNLYSYVYTQKQVRLATRGVLLPSRLLNPRVCITGGRVLARVG